MIREERLGSDLLRWTIDNPSRRNAIGPDALDWITARAATLTGEVVQLTGAGDHAFCAGFDLTHLTSAAREPLPDASLIRASTAIAAADALFVAVARGHVIGAGVELLCACDVRIVGDDVTFSVPAAKLGVVYHPAGVTRMAAALGSWTTTRLLLVGDRVSAVEAAAHGAGLWVVSGDIVRDQAEQTVETLATSPSHVRGAHRDILRRLESGTVDEPFLLRYEQARERAYAALLGTAGARKPGDPADC